jgi:hypothetical protein
MLDRATEAPLLDSALSLAQRDADAVQTYGVAFDECTMPVKRP